MIIIRPKGGLGNQLFQYAAALALAHRHGVALRIDPTWYEGEANCGPDPDRRTYDLGAFRISALRAGNEDLARFGGVGAMNNRPSRVRRLLRRLGRHRVWRNDEMGFVGELGRLGPRVYMEGYFQHPAHFAGMEHILRTEFVLRQPLDGEGLRLAHRLATESSVCIQVRRTDFITNGATARVHAVCDADYHWRAWGRLKSEVPGAKGYVFTDDNVWAKSYFEGWANVEVVPPEMDGPAFLHRFEIMRACRHFIIMNSTWGWWAAWLGAGADSRVLMPDEWLRGRMTRELGLACAGWELLQASHF